jgi:hypothetical protein
VVCGTGSYGNLCQACGGHVCPDHQVGVDEWCSLCEDEFAEFKSTYRLPPSALTAAAAVVAVTLIGSVASAWSSGNTGLSALFAPLLMCVMWAIVLPIASKLWVKLRFMRGLSPRTPPLQSIDADGQELKAEGQEQPITSEAQVKLPPVPSVIPDYDRTTMHGSVAPPIEPFAAGLVGMLPPAERLPSVAPAAEPPPSSRGPMVIRVEVPSLTPATVMPHGSESTLPMADGQLSAMARLAINSAIPTAPAPAPEPAATPTPASLVPSSEGPEISVGVLSMPHLRSQVPAAAPEPAPDPTPTPSTVEAADIVAPAPAPVLISMSPAPVPTPIGSEPSPAGVPAFVGEASDAAHPDEGSGVRHVLIRNQPGVLREACSPVVYNRCS